jgi:hypothetical protein
MPPAKSSPFRLLVEGKDDLHSVTGLLQRHGYDWNANVNAPFVYNAEGIEPLLEALPLAIKTYARVGVIIDADLRPTDRWARIEGILNASGLTLPSGSKAGGLVMSIVGHAQLERLGIWIMPDNQSSGILEDFLQKLVPARDPCWQHAEASTSEAIDKGAPLKANDHSKGTIHTWLAWQDPPGVPFGTALTSHILSHDSHEALAFVAWFKRLFD